VNTHALVDEQSGVRDATYHTKNHIGVDMKESTADK
jgi:hypothetical protein